MVLVPADNERAEARTKLVALATALNLEAISGRPLKFVPVDIHDWRSLRSRAAELKAAAILALPGLPQGAISAIAEAAAALQTYSLALDPGMVEQGLLLGVALRDEHPQVVLNAEVSKALGARFDASVLKIARFARAAR